MHHPDRSYKFFAPAVRKHIEQERRIETCGALHRIMSGGKARIASGGDGGDSCGGGTSGNKGARRYCTSKGPCLGGSDCSFVHAADAIAPKGKGKWKKHKSSSLGRSAATGAEYGPLDIPSAWRLGRR